ncbi:MAG: TonB-dependent receptor [Ignavibacteria bacterium]|nr:TonB-dependent receptor [Ignavibacteria bacterium]
MKLKLITLIIGNFVIELFSISNSSYRLHSSIFHFEDTSKIYSMSEIYIIDRLNYFDNLSSGFVKKIKLSEQLSSVSIGNLVSSRPGIFTKSYGSEGSLQTISIRGSGSEYTSVFINGINYNNSLNGVFDFSKFSSDEISEIIIKKSNDFEPINNNSFGNSIELNPFEKNDTSKSIFKFQIGSFGFRGFQLKTSGYELNTYYKINFSKKSAKNDYEYKFNDETGIRHNADVNQNSLSTALINNLNIFNRPVLINSFLHFMDKQMGLPNFVSSNRHNNSGTREREKNFSSSINSKVFLSDDIFMNVILGYNNNQMKIDDPLLSINLKTKEYLLKENSINSKLFFNHFTKNFVFTFGFSKSIEFFDKNEKRDDGYVNQENLLRKNFSSNLKLSYDKKFAENLIFKSSLFVSLNYVENHFNSHNKIYKFPNFRFGSSINVKSLGLSSYANVGTGIRVPNFYEYSFSRLTSLTNRELEPENILNYEIGTRYENENFLFEFTYFTFDVQNKIIWRPQRVAFFSPTNLGRIKSNGIELNIEQIKLSNNFSIGANYTFTNALKKSRLTLNDQSYNKQLPYIPKHKASLIFYYKLKSIEFEFSSTYYSRRFVTEDNDVLFSLDPVIISNLSSTFYYSINSYHFRLNLLIQNLFNTSYQLIQSFPMPGREYRLTIQMEV